MNKRTLELTVRLNKEGFSIDEVLTLRRIERTLHRWAEAECNGDIQRDETTGRPFYHYNGPNVSNGPAVVFVPDREKGALRRLAVLLRDRPDFTFYHQGDPRGCALYLVRKADIRPGTSLDSVYSSIGIAICD